MSFTAYHFCFLQNKTIFQMDRLLLSCFFVKQRKLVLLTRMPQVVAPSSFFHFIEKEVVVISSSSITSNSAVNTKTNNVVTNAIERKSSVYVRNIGIFFIYGQLFPINYKAVIHGTNKENAAATANVAKNGILTLRFACDGLGIIAQNILLSRSN